MRRTALLILLLAVSIGAVAETSTPAPAAAAAAKPPAPGERCKQAEYHQFDFWIGEWQVFDPGGSQVGVNRIEPILLSCALSENWTDGNGGQGKSYNAYDPAERQWHQFWVAESGSTLWLSGGLVGTSMVLSGVRPGAKGTPAKKHRITWTPNADGSVRQHWESSTDEGRTWTTAFDGEYRKGKAK